ncbi:hypothetical protein QTI33_09910 [Variovorax sp. J22P271]|nr:hypothetical protein [Variovorax sp. J22P271]MDM0032439.1 hypothetical protein [Variovorax sp. J22P271]
MIQEQMKRMAMPVEEKGAEAVASAKNAPISSLLLGSQVDTRV